ncbi:alpha/beta hydrolase [Mycobacterium sp. B14F4]|uniref:alpha/beta fold hydrolase n=1 Tax=Mycobacterium sp. B14F4 TaxID=3153565 RepID=UPI00325FC5B7
MKASIVSSTIARTSASPGASVSAVPSRKQPLWGDRDRYIPFATVRDLADHIPGATLTRLTGADHYVMEERPVEVTAVILQLLKRPCVVSRDAGISPA